MVAFILCVHEGELVVRRHVLQEGTVYSDGVGRRPLKNMNESLALGFDCEAGPVHS